MSEHNKENVQENPSKAKPAEETLADYAAKKLGFKKGKLPKDWTRVIFKR